MLIQINAVKLAHELTKAHLCCELREKGCEVTLEQIDLIIDNPDIVGEKFKVIVDIIDTVLGGVYSAKYDYYFEILTNHAL